MKNKKWNVVLGSAIVFGLLTGCGTENGADKTQGAGIESSKKDEVNVNFSTSIATKDGEKGVVVSYKIKNISGKDKKLTFSSGLKADYILYDKNGNKIKQYSEELMSTQAVEEVTLTNDEELMSEFIISDLAKGEYVLEVFLTAKEEKATVKTDIIISKDMAVTGNGVFVGQIDPHTVEIIVDGTATAFQLSDEAIEQLKSIKDGESISFIYTNGNDVKTINNFTLESSSEKIALTKSVLEVDQELVDLHTTFRETRDVSVLKDLKPFDIFQLYMWTKAGEDYETLYHFHNKADATVDMETYKKENMTGEASKEKNTLMINLDKVRDFEVVQTASDRVYVAFTMPNSSEKLEFKLAKGENGVWHAMWTPFQ
ncbi:BsuPI-related putative proteinase inhibitor [Fredinandcohnia humi]